MSIQMQGLTQFQQDLYDVATKKLPKEAPKLMRKIGSKARTTVAKKSRSLVKRKQVATTRSGNVGKSLSVIRAN